MSSALVKPEPAVGQVWQLADRMTIVQLLKSAGNDDFYVYKSPEYSRIVSLEELSDAIYLGTLDELRARATAGDLLYTDNSAVVARLSAENERLRAALESVVTLADPRGFIPGHELRQCFMVARNALAAVEGDAA